MDQQLPCILLVDDDNNDNFFHKRTLEKINVAKSIEVVNTGVQALEYLQDETRQRPNIIFLDINMPVMNGWEFLEEYAHLPSETRGKTLVIMLTTSLNPADRQRADENPLVNGFINKPLDEDNIRQIMTAYPGCMNIKNRGTEKDRE